jgi:hypothetical protein
MKFAQSRVSSLRFFLALPLLLTVALVSFALVPGASRASAASAPAPWSDSLSEYGMPATPTIWEPNNWDVQVHTRDMNHTGSSGNITHMADHGSGCEGPPLQHQISTWQQAVFICRNHVMTAIADEGYGEVTMTPDRMADWSNGPVTIGFSVSTLHTSQRDWITVDITPFSEQLALPFSEGGVDLQGMPAHYIEARVDNCDGGKTIWRMVRESNEVGNSFGDQQSVSDCVEDVTGIKPSAATRTPFEMVISQTGFIFRVATSSPVAGGKVLMQGNWTKPLTFSRGVVQFSHHSYNPAKCDSCTPDTWHWSNFSISNAVQYTLLRPTDHRIVAEPGDVVTFAAPAPNGSFLKFAGIGEIKVSYDGGKTYHVAQKPPMDASLFHDEHFTSYLDPVPPGAQQAIFKVSGGWYGPGMARDFSIVSESLEAVAPLNPAPAATSAVSAKKTAATPKGISVSQTVALVIGGVLGLALALLVVVLRLRRRPQPR